VRAKAAPLRVCKGRPPARAALSLPACKVRALRPLTAGIQNNPVQDAAPRRERGLFYGSLYRSSDGFFRSSEHFIGNSHTYNFLR